MATYEVDELTFEVPDDYVDRSVNIFFPASAKGLASSIVMTREPRTDAPLAQQVAALLKEAETKVPGLKVIGHRERVVGTVPGREVRLHAQTQRLPTYQRQVYLSHYGSLLSLTVTTPRAHSGQCDAIIERIIGSLRLAKA